MNSGDQCDAIITTAIKNDSFGCLDNLFAFQICGVQLPQVLYVDFKLDKYFGDPIKGRWTNYFAGREYLIQKFQIVHWVVADMLVFQWSFGCGPMIKNLEFDHCHVAINNLTSVIAAL